MKPRRLIVTLGLTLAMGAGPLSADVSFSTSTPSVTVDIGIRLGALMGVEATSLSGVSGDRLRQIGTPFVGRQDASDSVTSHILSAEALDALPRPRGNSQWRCMTEALYFEARGETIEGQYAVAEVILNRVDSANYPDTICDVVYQGNGRRYACQFTYSCDGIPEVVTDQQAWNRAGQIARIMMEDAPRSLTAGATHYHADRVNPRWARIYPRTSQYGQHIFYRQQY